MTMKLTELEKRKGLKLENRRREAEKQMQQQAQRKAGAANAGAKVNPLIGALLARGKTEK